MVAQQLLLLTVAHPYRYCYCYRYCLPLQLPLLLTNCCPIVAQLTYWLPNVPYLLLPIIVAQTVAHLHCPTLPTG